MLAVTGSETLSVLLSSSLLIALALTLVLTLARSDLCGRVGNERLHLYASFVDMIGDSANDYTMRKYSNHMSGGRFTDFEDNNGETTSATR